MGKDYYKILGVSKDADEEAIKKAYKKTALKHHPDRGGDADKFKELSEAVEVLTDKNKRHIYDLGGEEALKGGPPPGAGAGGAGGNPFASAGGFPGGGGTKFSFSSGGGFPGGMGGGSRGGAGFAPTDANDIFASLFGGMGAGGMPKGSRGGMPNMGGSSFPGFGSGMDLDSDEDDMSGFPGGFGGGGGARPRARSSQAPKDEPPSELVKPLPLSLEDIYTGATRKMRIRRKKLDGTEEPKTIEVHVTKGWKAGTKIRYKQAGHEERKGGKVVSQTLVFVLEEKPHDRFKRSGDDLVYTLKVPLAEALTGQANAALPGKKTVTSLDGRMLTYTVPYPSSNGGAPLYPGQEIRISGEGMPKKGGPAKGDLIVQIQVEFPKQISAQQAQALRQTLSPNASS